ncbi:MAG: rhodanese-related sulfurtransferase [Mesorhizobium sp.]
MDPVHDENPVHVAALYRFVAVADADALRRELGAFCCSQGLKGTLLVAPEGVNGTVAGTLDALDGLVQLLAARGVDNLELKFSTAAEMPFHRMKVRLKREIVTMGVEGIDPQLAAGSYVEPQDWNALIDDPDTVVIDTRNDYEVAIGTFNRALDPETRTFRDFPAWADANRDQLQGRKVAMFCTGGIRCEKATAYVRSLGLDEVYHLKGGILKYLETVPEEQSLWQGECFVFDERVSVGHGLQEGDAELCRACRRPLNAADRASPLYREGISCAYCADARSPEDRERYAERHRQVVLAQGKGRRHIGS